MPLLLFIHGTELIESYLADTYMPPLPLH